jgi:hypothetical protein
VEAGELLAAPGPAEPLHAKPLPAKPLTAGPLPAKPLTAGPRSSERLPVEPPPAVSGDTSAAGPEPAPPGPRVEPDPEQAPSDKQRKRWQAPLVAAVVLLLTAGAVAVAALQPWTSREAAPTTTSLGLTANDAAELVRRHYEALPEDTAAAYANLAAPFQRPFEEYQAFWGQYDDVRVEGIVVVEISPARYAVRVDVNFTHAGTASHGRYELGVWPDGGRLQIFSSQQLE